MGEPAGIDKQIAALQQRKRELAEERAKALEPISLKVNETGDVWRNAKIEARDKIDELFPDMKGYPTVAMWNPPEGYIEETARIEAEKAEKKARKTK